MVFKSEEERWGNEILALGPVTQSWNLRGLGVWDGNGKAEKGVLRGDNENRRMGWKVSSAGVMSNSLMFKPNEGTMTATAVHSSNTGVTISENVFTVRPEITYHSNPTLSRCSENLESLGVTSHDPRSQEDRRWNKTWRTGLVKTLWLLQPITELYVSVFKRILIVSHDLILGSLSNKPSTVNTLFLFYF